MSPLRAYLNDVHQRFGFGRRSRPGEKRLALLPPTIRARLEECERLDSWRALCKAYEPGWRSSGQARLFLLGPGGALKNWFRRSGIYRRCSRGERPNASATARRLCNDTERYADEETTTYVWLLNGVIFAKPSMDFGNFRIKRLGDKELSLLFDVPTNRLFFPNALQDMKPFADLWYVIVERVERKVERNISLTEAKSGDEKSANPFAASAAASETLPLRFSYLPEVVAEVA